MQEIPQDVIPEIVDAKTPISGKFKQFPSFVILSLGFAAMFSWVVLFSLGLLINSSYYREALVKKLSAADFFMATITYTPTNIAILAISAAFAGGCASHVAIGEMMKKFGHTNDFSVLELSDSQMYMSENPFNSMLRGLVVYFAFLAGVYVVATDPFSNTTPQQYAKSAGFLSLVSFVVGYDPTVFRALLNLSAKAKIK